MSPSLGLLERGNKEDMLGGKKYSFWAAEAQWQDMHQERVGLVSLRGLGAPPFDLY